jgi:short-subunit dehydrogenase
MDLARKGVGVSLVSPGFVREAGMFADAGAKPPPGMGTTTPDRVGAATAKAIERDKVEVVPAPPQLRAMSHFALAAPEISVRAQSGSIGQRTAKAVADGHPPSKW